MNILIRVAQSRGELSSTFQLALMCAIACAADHMRKNPLPPLYSTDVKFQDEPWQGQGVEEFATPWMVLERKWGDCDDLVIYRGAELVSQGIGCHPVIVHDTQTDKYHTLLWIPTQAGPIFEDPSLQRLGRRYQCQAP